MALRRGPQGPPGPNKKVRRKKATRIAKTRGITAKKVRRKMNSKRKLR